MRLSAGVACAGALAVGVALLVGGAHVAAQATGAQALNPQFEQLIDRYLKEVRGIGGRSAPNDLSPAGFDRQIATQRAVLKDLQAFDRSTLTFDQEHRPPLPAEHPRRGHLIEDEKVPRWKQDPRLYMNYARHLYRLEVDPRPPAARAAEIDQRRSRCCRCGSRTDRRT